MLNLRALIKGHNLFKLHIHYNIGYQMRFRRKRIMYSRRLIGNMSVRALAWLAVAVAAQVGPAVAQHRDEYAVVLRDAPLARQVASRRELGSTPALDRAARIRGAQTTLRGLIDARHIRV